MVDFAKMLADKKAAKEKVDNPTESGAAKIQSLAERIAAKRERDKLNEQNNATAQTNQINPQKVLSESKAEVTSIPDSPQQSILQQTPRVEVVQPSSAKKEEQNTTKKMSLAEKIALKKQLAAEARLAEAPAIVLDSSHKDNPDAGAQEYTGAFSLNIRLNEKQLAAKEMALSGKSFCLIGAAGTGKTTTQRSVAETLLADNRLTVSKFKIPGSNPRQYVSAPSIAFVAFTRRASSNLQRAIHKNPELADKLKYNVMTIHALLEFEPEEYLNPETDKMSFRFSPQKTANDPLNITHLVIEEASMVGLDLWEQLYDALPVGVQIIFIGDINQLPPVFGSSILNFALVQLPVVELTEVYRQQGDSLILANAHNILKGQALEEGPGFTIIRGKSAVPVGQEKMSMTLGNMFKSFYDKDKYYDPEQDIILSPYNKQPLGTDNMNKWIAQFLGERRGAIVHEVVAGFNKHYLAVGDRVMYEKQDCTITEIRPNVLYQGQDTQLPGVDLSRFGVRVLGLGKETKTDLDDLLLGYENFTLTELADTDMERKQQCSHIVKIVGESGQIKELSAAGDFGANFSLGYVLTVHKSQGCEWRKVFFILHKDHSNMLFRELFYTGETRAREEVVLIAKDTVIDKAIKTQRIKGNSLQEKIEYFNSGAVEAVSVYCTK